MSILDKLMGKGASRGLVGLDISSSAVKLLELARRGDRYVVESYAVEPLPVDAVTDKQINQPELVAEAVKKAFQRAGTGTKNVALAVAGSSVITKIVQMSSSLSEVDMEEQIKAEADRQAEIIVAEASRDAQKIMGEGDAKATAIYADAFGRDPQFAQFYRSLEAYRASFRNKSDVMVVDPSSDFFKTFRGPGAAPAPAPARK